MNKELMKERAKRNWYKFSRNPLSIVGLVVVVSVILFAIFADFVAPYPQHAFVFVDFKNAKSPPTSKNLCGTDLAGRDVLSRIFFGFRYSLLMAISVLSVATPPGVFLGLIAGYNRDTWVDTVIMRVADVFLSVPSMVLALAVCSMLEPTLYNAMLAVTVMWWPWYTRLVYGLSSSIKNEYFIQAAEVTGASTISILLGEILPNCLSPIFTKMTLDVGWVILIGSTLSFVGLGAQPPTPDLGTMVSDGSKYIPSQWWISLFPALFIVLIILGFNLLGDGVRDMLAGD
ncbi:putative D,D-dipeptide transport system permease protein DdpC [subsurface metagenome]